MDPGWGYFRRFYDFLQIPFLEEMVSEIDVDMAPAGSPLGGSMFSYRYHSWKRWYLR